MSLIVPFLYHGIGAAFACTYLKLAFGQFAQDRIADGNIYWRNASRWQYAWWYVFLCLTLWPVVLLMIFSASVL